jgi:RNA polymerase sigma-70 factor (ECF subfamily)
MEHESVEAFVERVRNGLVGALFLYLGDRAAAEDLAQEALARAWPRWGELDRPDAWVYRVAFNLARSRWRRRRRERIALDALEAQAAAGRTTDETDDGSVAILRAAVAALPDRQRQAVVLRFYLDLPVAEIAAVMACAEGTVKATLHQATRSLRDRLPAPVEVSDD